MADQFQIIDYTLKSFAIVTTKEWCATPHLDADIKTFLFNNGAKYNQNLTVNGVKTKGFIISKKNSILIDFFTEQQGETELQVVEMADAQPVTRVTSAIRPSKVVSSGSNLSKAVFSPEDLLSNLLKLRNVLTLTTVDIHREDADYTCIYGPSDQVSEELFLEEDSVKIIDLTVKKNRVIVFQTNI